MKCLRCGYCCKNYCVVIVDDPYVGICDNNLIVHEGNGKPCKHLIGDTPGKYLCSIHNKPWYKDTPCFKHGQIEKSPDCCCRMGMYVLEKIK
jgi:hypothetical protein